MDKLGGQAHKDSVWLLKRRSLIDRLVDIMRQTDGREQ